MRIGAVMVGNGEMSNTIGQSAFNKKTRWMLAVRKMAVAMKICFQWLLLGFNYAALHG